MSEHISLYEAVWQIAYDNLNNEGWSIDDYAGMIAIDVEELVQERLEGVL